ncbi:Hypothetical protein GbCGDNIH4_0962 [Granulibacter bethesdensis CGDNIH4]|nr:Hypothetical protein GbCGDNIH4_0962 [Granulibacter bethesdensis CGDNIH4]
MILSMLSSSLLRVPHPAFCLGLLLLSGGCSLSDSHTAQRGRTRFVGLSAVDLQTCLGAPDQKNTAGDTTILTYYANSTGNGGINITLPIIGGGLSVSGGGYCHATFRLDHDRVTQIHYSGEKDARGAPDAYCAPIIRQCLRDLDASQPDAQAEQHVPAAWRRY